MKFLEGYKIYIEFEKIDRKMLNNPLNIKYKRASVEMNCTPKVRFFCLTFRVQFKSVAFLELKDFCPRLTKHRVRSI